MAGKKDKIKDSERFSIIVPALNRCMVCGTDQRVCIHEVFYGTANRKKSKEFGLVVPLCYEHHQGTNGVHFNKVLDLKLKQQAEKIWLKENNATIDEFIKVFGKNYLDGGE